MEFEELEVIALCKTVFNNFSILQNRSVSSVEKLKWKQHRNGTLPGEENEERTDHRPWTAGEGENAFGVCHVFVPFHDSFVHVTDFSGEDSLSRDG